jgi:plasmid stabilization system protein ParE
VILRIVFVREARAHLAEIARWWRENRPGQELFERELTKTLTFLAQQPELGAPYLEAPQPGVRRTLLRKTQFHVYYSVDRARRLVRILAIWHTAREHGPPL